MAVTGRCHGFAHLQQKRIQHVVESLHPSFVSFGVLVRARRPAALFSEFAINFGMDEQAFVGVLAIREKFAGISRVHEFALVVLQTALGPVAASRILFASFSSLGRHLELIMRREVCRRS